MPRQHKSRNVGVEHGVWGENVAADYLRRRGYVIVGRNERPVAADERLEIDIVAYDAKNDAMVFVEVKQHASHSPYERRLRSVCRRKFENLRRACNVWRWRNKWRGGYRFDVVEVYGVPGGRFDVDHIPHVELFAKRDRFVKWD